MEIERLKENNTPWTPAALGDAYIQERFEYRSRALTNPLLLQFLQMQLRPSSSFSPGTFSPDIFSIDKEHPALFGEFPSGVSLSIRHENRFVCHVGFVLRDYQHSQCRLKVGLIGSVVTHPEYRGMGLAGRLLRDALAELKRRGCILSLLWSDQKDFYQPLGFQRAGREMDLRFSAESVMETSPGVRDFDPNHDVSLIWRLYQKHEARVDRSLEEQKNLTKIPNVKIFVTEKNQVITSYLAVNKGADFEDYIHEWGGDLYELQKNISYCQRNIFPERPLTMIAPHFYDLGPIRQMAVERWEGVLGLVKLLDRSRLLATYYDFLKKNQIPYKWDHDREVIEVAGQKMPVRTDADCISLIIGDEEHTSHPVLPLFLWGFDSI